MVLPGSSVRSHAVLRLVALALLSAHVFSEEEGSILTTPARQTKTAMTMDNGNSYPPGSNCTMTVADHSLAYFKSRLELDGYDFIHFNVTFNTTQNINSNPETFEPTNWVWTYSSPSGIHPFLYWNIDYTVLSFGLLNAKTLMTYMYIKFNVQDNCNITFGTMNTTWSIANALKDMIANLSNPKYHNSSFCYLAEAPQKRHTMYFQAAQYFMYPITYINYNCCVTYYNYDMGKLMVECLPHQINKWMQCTLGPYIIGIIMFLFYPIVHVRLASWIASDEKVKPKVQRSISLYSSIQDHPGTSESNPDDLNDDDDNADWLFLSGCSPYTMTDNIFFLSSGLRQRWPVLMSRFRRLVVLIIMPAVIYCQLLYYGQTMRDKIALLVRHGTPMGFLSLLGEVDDQAKSLAPLFGGPRCLVALYYTLGLLLLVLPKSLKQVVEDGMPVSSTTFATPLCLSVIDVSRLSMIEQHTLQPGYDNFEALLRCGIYLVFSKPFWKWVIKTQVERYGVRQTQAKAIYLMKMILAPFYIFVCLLEMLLCFVLYGIPFSMFSLVTIRGMTRSLIRLRNRVVQLCQSPIMRRFFLDNYFVKMVAFLIAFSVFIMFAYITTLVFIETFAFLSQIIVFCLVAVIVYPSVAFGYLFFFIVVIYYMFRLIHNFGEGYLELLSEAVDITRNLQSQPNHLTFYGDNIQISNLKVPRNIKAIMINNTVIDISPSVLQKAIDDNDIEPKLKIVNNMYGIPRDLFHFLINKHRPPHQQILKIVFQIASIVALIAITMSISSKYVTGPTSEISDVMHVIFIVAIGALPRILEIALTNSSSSIKREIEMRRLEQSILEYWNNVVSKC